MFDNLNNDQSKNNIYININAYKAQGYWEDAPDY